MPRLLVLSSNKQLCENIKADLEPTDYLAWVQSNHHLELEEVLRLAPDVVLFDWPGWDEEKAKVYHLLSAEECLKHLELAIILLLGEGSLSRLSPQLKFDDFLLLPYRLPELSLRLKRVLAKKNKSPDQSNIQIRDLTIDMARYEVRFWGVPLELTYKEYELLKYLATHPGRAFTRDALLNAIWGYEYYGGTRTVDVHIRRIRAKLGDTQEEYIKTIRGVGYLFRAP